ncbi:MAG: c-type cytochrome [Candidatus Acidulodesulfobacterium ferriphilum]|uniref:C-type cytochrome n=1 Tax=Candidatus Acidulodesulfobacterium ferriphilum TaxID=2597223 RepID=A0A519BBP6_9DELT|nr:MAG: c-type cytochrome [Candidatus Acidulodesulfobacterium ferriphilum]
MAPGMKMPSVPKAAKKAGSKNLEAAAMKIINAQGCMGCHIINGKGGSIGPNLSKEGTKGRSIHWLEVQINTPKVHNPNTMMPNHALKPAQLETVAEYLESLK